MKMLQLTDIQGHAIYINPAHVVYFHKSSIDDHTVIRITDTTYVWKIKESPEQIVEMMANLREAE